MPIKLQVNYFGLSRIINITKKNIFLFAFILRLWCMHKFDNHHGSCEIPVACKFNNNHLCNCMYTCGGVFTIY